MSLKHTADHFHYYVGQVHAIISNVVPLKWRLVWSRKAELVNSAKRDWVSGLVTAHQANIAGCARTRGGLGAEFWAMIERYSKAIGNHRLQSLLLYSLDSSKRVSRSELFPVLW
jgi:hypothetical protein